MLMTPLPVARTLDEAAVNLLEYGYTRLQSRTLPRRVPTLSRRFATITEDMRRQLLVISHPREQHADGTNDLGFREVRRGDIKHNPRPDEIAEGRTEYDETKVVFHYNGRALGYWSGRGVGGLLREQGEFFSECGLIQGECVLLGYELAERLDRLLEGYNFVQRMREVEGAARLRLLRYLCDGEKPAIAQRHRDQCFITIHIRSDRPQLWLADRSNTHIIEDAQETRDDSVLVFLGRKAWEITRGKLDGIVHGVLDPTFQKEKRLPRHTAVFFLHASVYPEEQQWGHENIGRLAIPPFVSNYGMLQAA